MRTYTSRILLAFATALLVFACWTAVSVGAQQTNQFVVVLKAGKTTAGLRAIKAAGGQLIKLNSKVSIVTVSSTQKLFLTKLRASHSVLSVGRDGFFFQPKLRTLQARTSQDVPPPKTPAEAAAGCIDYYSTTSVGFSAGPEPLSPCQWDMRISNATSSGSYEKSLGAGVTVGIIDTGLDLNHPDIAPNIDIEKSCSFIRSTTPTSIPEEQATSCAQKDKVQDYAGHGTHVGGIVAGAINGFGISGVAPEAKLAGLHAGTAEGYFFTDSVVDALVWAGDQRLDVVNMSFFADPWLYNCRNDADQRAIITAIKRASNYAYQRGVVQLAAAGNEFTDLDHPTVDTISPDYPPDTAVERVVHRNCIVLPTGLPHVADVSAVGPATQLSFYSNFGFTQIEFTAGGGSSTQAPNPYGRVLNAYSTTATLAEDDPIVVNGRRVEDCDHPAGTGPDAPCALYVWIQGTSMASPHAAGVAALIRATHPGLSPDGVVGLEKQTANPLGCPAEPDPFFIGDPSSAPRCKGGTNQNNFYGSGLVDAAAAASH